MLYNFCLKYFFIQFIVFDVELKPFDCIWQCVSNDVTTRDYAEIIVINFFCFLICQLLIFFIDYFKCWDWKLSLMPVQTHTFAWPTARPPARSHTRTFACTLARSLVCSHARSLARTVGRSAARSLARSPAHSLYTHRPVPSFDNKT